jgi:hypothetical protein
MIMENIIKIESTPSPSTLQPKITKKITPTQKAKHTFPSLDIHLGDKRGTDPPINQYYPGSFRMKEAIHSPPSPHVAYFHPKGVYRYFHPHLIQSVGKTSPIFIK